MPRVAREALALAAIAAGALVLSLAPRFVASPPESLRWLWMPTVIGLCAFVALKIHLHERRAGRRGGRKDPPA